MFALTWLPDLFRKNNILITECAGWETRGHGDMVSPHFVICHHTADGNIGVAHPNLGMLQNGRSDLAGPLCNLALGEDGMFYMVAAGKAYHAGGGMWNNDSNGNSNAIGIEAKNNGIGEPWPAIQMQQYARGCAALVVYMKTNQNSVCGHKEYALPRGRKTDPNFDMNLFRSSIAKYIPDIHV